MPQGIVVCSVIRILLEFVTLLLVESEAKKKNKTNYIEVNKIESTFELISFLKLIIKAADSFQEHQLSTTLLNIYTIINENILPENLEKK